MAAIETQADPTLSDANFRRVDPRQTWPFRGIDHTTLDILAVMCSLCFLLYSARHVSTSVVYLSLLFKPHFTVD